MARARFKSKAKAKRSAKHHEKSEEPMTSNAECMNILGSIRKPSRKATRMQKRFFKDFLSRLEQRDKTLKQSDLKAASEDAMNHVFNEEKGEMELEWEVEEILDAATIDGELHYMVLWKGHLIQECTWETEANLANSKDAIHDFYVAFPKKTRGPRVAKKGRKSASETDN